MTPAEWVMVILFALLVIAFFGFMIVMSIKDEKYRKEHAEEERAQRENPFPEPIEECFRATVKDLRCTTRMVGTKTPRAVKEFLVVFEDESGKIRSFEVSEDYYAGFEIGFCGEVTLKNGVLYSFEMDLVE